MTASKRKGTRAETAVVRWLQTAWGMCHVERRALAGGKDRGDIAGLPGVCVEVKDQRRMELAAWVDEATVEAANAGTPVGVVWHKRARKGSPGDWYVTMSGEAFMCLLTRGEAFRG